MVPTCPEFTLDRLAFHIGEFSSFWTHVVCEGTGRDKPAYPADPGAAGRGPWVDALIGHLIPAHLDVPEGHVPKIPSKARISGAPTMRSVPCVFDQLT